MKRNYLYLFIMLLFAGFMRGQSTETFETESIGSTNFTDSGKVFNITSQAPAIFDVFLYSGGGWNGTSIDNRFIDNSGTTYFNTPVQFTISANGGSAFTLKSMYLFLSKSDLGLNVNGTLTITGKLGGAVQFTAAANSPFNTSMGVNNGFTLINMVNFGGANNSNISIDQFVITTTGDIAYVALDAMKWQCPSVVVTPVAQTNIACNGGATGSATVSASGGNGFVYDWTPGNPAGDGTATATGLSAGTWTCTVTNSCGLSNATSFTITQPSTTLTATQSQTDVSCNGGTNGTASVVASGGTGAYTYLWSPTGGTGATTTGRSAGSYTVTITDANGCSIQKNFTINAPAALTATQSQTDVSCNGGTNGTASVVASGGAGGYTYSWSPSGGTGATTTGRTAGNYTVTITDANSCSIQKSFTINAPAALTATQSQTDVSCNGGSNGTASVVASGGVGGYTYSWSPSGGTGATTTGRTAGNYTVTITDANGCAIQKNFTITQPSTLVASSMIVSEVTTSTSNDGSVSVSASGGTPSYTYLWSNGATTSTVTGLGTGTYFCVVTDANGCAVTTSTVELAVQIVAPIAYAVTGGGIYCQGSTGVAIGLENSELGVVYQLKRDGNNVGDVVNGTGSSLSFGNFTTEGGYTVVGTHVNNESTTPMTGEAVISTVNYVVTIGQPLVPCVPGMPVFLSGAVESVSSLTIVESVEGFTADYAPSNWIFTNTNADGNVDTSDAPASLSITSGNNGTDNSGTTDYSIVVSASGTLSFNWNYSTSDGAEFDYPQFIYNNVVSTFTDFSIYGSSTQSGTVTLEVTEGATFALRMYTVDNFAGAATVVISNFQAPQLTPVEANLLWTASNGGTIVGATDELETEVSTSGTYTLTASLGDCSFSQSVVVDFENPVLINTTWNGTEWSNGVPSFGNKAIIDGDLVVAEQLITCELEITANGSLTVQPNAAVGIVGKITNNATAADFVIENQGVLTQQYDEQNIGPVTINVTSYPLYRQDYTLWSSPVENHNLRIFSPQTIYNRFSSYDNTIGTVGDYVQEIFTMEDVANKTFATGKGYLIRSPNNWPEYVNNTIPGVPYEGVFKGVPENGSITIPLSTANGGFNLVGNPYPSPIDIEMFFNINPGIEETIYYWRKRNGATGSGYATYNSMGFVSSQAELAATGTALESMPLISVGQGFFVKSTGATALNFSNEMRGFMSNGVFLKSTPVEKHRLWLNLSNSTSTIGQALIGYTTGATQGVDSGYDSSYFNDSPVALTSLINGGEYSIQGLGLPFDAASSVALGFKTNAAGTYTISLSNFDGLFAENQDIFIKDNLTGLVHNVKESAYSFVATEGIANERFEVVYQAMLGTDNPDMDINKVMVYKQEKDIYINASSIVIQKVELYDIRGSLIQVLEDVNQTTATFHNLNIANQVVLVKITSVDNKVITKKIVY